jgi:hypothetical protein
MLLLPSWKNYLPPRQTLSTVEIKRALVDEPETRNRANARALLCCRSRLLELSTHLEVSPAECRRMRCPSGLVPSSRTC